MNYAINDLWLMRGERGEEERRRDWKWKQHTKTT
jgi:hypothetical protein